MEGERSYLLYFSSGFQPGAVPGAHCGDGDEGTGEDYEAGFWLGGHVQGIDLQSIDGRWMQSFTASLVTGSVA